MNQLNSAFTSASANPKNALIDEGNLPPSMDTVKLVGVGAYNQVLPFDTCVTSMPAKTHQQH